MKERLRYFDMLKGIAILLVVMGHVIAFGVREIDRAFIFKVIGCVHMPLFFFISGWFSFRTDNLSGSLKMPSLSKRFLQLMVPLAILPPLWVWYFPHSGVESPLEGGLGDLWMDSMKHGYWFTLCLFEFSLIFAAIFPLLKKYSGLIANIVIAVSVSILLCLVEYFNKSNEIIYGILGLNNISMFWLPFIIGFIASRHRAVFNRMVSSSAWVTVCMILFAPTLYVCCYPWDFSPEIGNWFIYLNQSVMHISLAVIAIAVVKPWSEKVYSPEASRISVKIADFWCLLGRKSLSIYLLHYFFLFPMGYVRPALESFNVSLVPLGVFSFIVALCIIAFIFPVDAIIVRSPRIALLLTGIVPKNIQWKRSA